MIQARVSTAQALNHLSEMTSKEAAQLPEGLTFTQLGNLLEAVEAAQRTLGELRQAAERHMGWLEEVGDSSTLKHPALPDFRPAA